MMFFSWKKKTLHSCFIWTEMHLLGLLYIHIICGSLCWRLRLHPFKEDLHWLCQGAQALPTQDSFASFDLGFGVGVWGMSLDHTDRASLNDKSSKAHTW